MLREIFDVIDGQNFKWFDNTLSLDNLPKAGLQFDDDHSLFFEDNLYFTRWSMTDFIFKTRVSYLKRPSDDFGMMFQDLFPDLIRFGQRAETIDAEVMTPFHRNRHLEICYVVSGEFKIKVEQEELIMLPGEALLLDTSTLHGDYIRKENCEVIFIGISNNFLNNDILNRIDEVDMVKFLRFALIDEKSTSQYIHFKPKYGKEKIEVVLLELFKEIREKDFGHTLIISGLLTRLLSILTIEWDFYLVNSNQDKHKQVIFDEVEKYMMTNFRNVKLQDLAVKFNFSEQYFNRLTKEVRGLTYSELLKKIRIEKSQELLTQTTMPINSVALEVGYSNTRFFYQQFQKQHDMTPNEYRKKFFSI